MITYVTCVEAFEAVDHTVNAPTKNALYGKPTEKSKPSPWEYGYVLTT
ncbi:hypothetical protein [Commensalibacter oyaizuii]|uniref:Uncharacterized protein n=1 Tax=Commensalibacter oyaizuii TaxID=3043873 RepID=A0ABT6Q3Y6_9PROT|nr:hypothetical protein [Commensalibacter sp. TBRC 16381]MDI2091812.1 hypothetical protein [Commensalibacter sp. TBRC 16381]